MKVPLEWLGDRVDLKGLSEDEIARSLTMAGLEVEEIHGGPGERVLVTKVTPNRGDWMSITGVAREAAAALKRPFQGLPAQASVDSGEAGRIASVDVRDVTLCPRYGLRVIRNVAHGPSPDYIARRLTEAGMRPLGVVVDITNYVMIELGQPLHAFDYDKIPSGKIVVRVAEPGEEIETLDGSQRPLPGGVLVIADETHPIAVAGIMGGDETEVSDSTTSILLESAHFDAGVVRRGSKALGLTTEASYRFERHVDPALVTIALDRACELLEKHAGATVVPGVIDTNPLAADGWTIELRVSRVNAVLGERLTPEQISEALARLDLAPIAAKEGFVVAIPSFRPDLRKEIDLIEEVGRMIGYESLPDTLPPARGAGGGDLREAVFDSGLRDVAISQGLVEAYTHTLTAESPFDDPAIAAKRVRIRVALSTELSGLRQSLIPNLLEVLALNARHRQPVIRLFEIGKVFETHGPGRYFEKRRIAAALTGGDLAYPGAKGIVESILAKLHLTDVAYRVAEHHGMHPGRCADILFEGRLIGFVAEADPDLVKSKLDVPSAIGRVAVFELDVDALRAAADGVVIRYRHLPKFPSLTRDLAMIFDRSVAYGRIESAARAAAGDLAESVSLVSVYEGERVAADKKSVAIRLILRAADRTLTDVDADTVLAAVKSALAHLGGQER